MQTNLQKYGAAEKIFFILVLFVLSGSLFPFNMSHYSTAGTGTLEASPNHYFWYALGAFYGITGLLLLYRWQQALLSVRSNPWIVLLLLFACLSVSWSTAPELTLRRAIAFLGTNIIGVYIASRFSLQEILSLLAKSMWAVFILSLVFIVFFPEYGINPGHHHQGAWRGVFSQKQAFAVYFSLAFLVFLGQALYSCGIKFFISLLGMGCCIFSIQRSDSKTALVLYLLISMVFIALAFFVRREYRTRSMWLVVAFVIATVMLWGGGQYLASYGSTQQSDTEASSMSAAALQSLDRDKTLTGRTIIWTEVIKKVIKCPVLGYGYVGHVWPSELGMPYKDIRKVILGRLNFYVNQSHSGYIQLFLALGGVGAFFLILAIGTIAKNWLLYAVTTGVDYKIVWSGLYLIWFLAANVTTTLIAGQNLIYWPLFIIIGVMCTTRQHGGNTEHTVMHSAEQEV